MMCVCLQGSLAAFGQSEELERSIINYIISSKVNLRRNNSVKKKTEATKNEGPSPN